MPVWRCSGAVVDIADAGAEAILSTRAKSGRSILHCNNPPPLAAPRGEIGLIRGELVDDLVASGEHTTPNSDEYCRVCSHFCL